jgi:hypothetical protein
MNLKRKTHVICPFLMVENDEKESNFTTPLQKTQIAPENTLLTSGKTSIFPSSTISSLVPYTKEPSLIFKKSDDYFLSNLKRDEFFFFFVF